MEDNQGEFKMEDNKYQYDENGFREDLKDDPDVLHQPDADRTQRDLVILDYDEKRKLRPSMTFQMMFWKK